LRLADMSVAAGAAGIVCSPREVSAIRSRFGKSDDGGPVLVVPGIRPEGAAPDDQRRTMPPEAALEAGADVIVVGRPITGAADPGAAARSLSAALTQHRQGGGPGEPLGGSSPGRFPRSESGDPFRDTRSKKEGDKGGGPGEPLGGSSAGRFPRSESGDPFRDTRSKKEGN
jgi:orotidine 5'-phosphate decarboxylase/HUMPS family protein